MKKYCYWAHNLIVSSEIELPELIPANAFPDVEIRFNETPESIDTAVIKKEYLQVSRNECLFNAGGVAKFYIKNGNTIYIKRYPNTTDIEIRVYLLNRIWGIMLAQQNQYALQGCSVLLNDNCYLFTGSTMSKALLGNYFREQGNTVLADSISLASLNIENKPIVFQGFQNARYDATIPRNQSDLLKQPIHLDQIVVTENAPVEDFTFEVLSKTDAFINIIKNTFQLGFIKDMTLADDAFQHFTKLSQKINVIKLLIPQSNFSLFALKSYIENLDIN